MPNFDLHSSPTQQSYVQIAAHGIRYAMALGVYVYIFVIISFAIRCEWWQMIVSVLCETESKPIIYMICPVLNGSYACLRFVVAISVVVVIVRICCICIACNNCSVVSYCVHNFGVWCCGRETLSTQTLLSLVKHLNAVCLWHRITVQNYFSNWVFFSVFVLNNNKKIAK